MYALAGEGATVQIRLRAWPTQHVDMVAEGVLDPRRALIIAPTRQEAA